MSRMRPSCRLISVLSFGCVLVAEQLPIRIFTQADGLSYNAVRHIRRDSHGFLWFCAGDRLNRFDGYRFTPYSVGSGPSDILEEKPGIYWVATYGGGVYRLEFPPAGADGKPKVSAYPLGPDPNARLVNTIYLDRLGRIWAGTDNGLYLLDQDMNHATGSFRKVELGIPSMPGFLTEVGAFAEDREGSLWIGTSYGPVRRLPDGRMVHYIAEGGEKIRFVRALAVDENDRLWIGHSRGFIIFVPEARASLAINGAFGEQAIPIARKGEPEERQITLPEAAGVSHWYTTPPVWAVQVFSDREIMIGTYGSGIWSIASGKIRHYTTARGLSEDLIECLAEDIDGNRWIGSRRGGAMKLMRSGFTGYDESDGAPKTKVISICRTQAGEVCVIGNRWLVTTFDGRRFRTSRLNLEPASDRRPFLGGDLYPLIQDHLGDWWASSASGVEHIASPARGGVPARPRPLAKYGMREGLGSDLADALFEDSHGDIWIGTGNGSAERGGVAKWERKTNSLHVFNEAEGLPADIIPSTFAEDAAGNLWIGLFNGGFLRYGKGGFLRFNDAANTVRGGVRSLYRDSRGRLWIGTYFGGAGRIDQPEAATPHIRYYTAADGLTSNHVSGFAEDPQGSLYVGTGGGIDRLEPGSGAIQHCGSPPAAGVIEALLWDKGALWVGTSAGIWRMTPPAEYDSAPGILISSVAVGGKPAVVAELGATSLPAIRAPFRQGEMRVEYFSPNFGGPVRYQYRVNRAEWSPASEQRLVELANMAPGRYTFAVRAIRENGTASAAPATFTFTVAAPLWRQWWVITLAVGIMMLVGYRLHRYRVIRLLELERVRLRIATDLHDDIGSTLSQIAVLSEVVSHELPAGNGVAERLSTIAGLSRDSVDSLSDIVWAINPKRDHLSDLTYRMRRFAGDLLSPRCIEFHFTAPSSADDLTTGADLRREVFLIFKEAVNNAVRHSGCTRIEAAFEVDNGFLELQVADNGRGLDGADEGRGNGVPSMRQRAERLGGTLAVQGGPGGGTTVRLRAPVDGTRRRVRLRQPYISM